MPPISRRTFLQGLLAGAVVGPYGLPALAQPALRSVLCPILMYHYIAIPPDDADATLRDLTVTPQNFAAHLDYLLQAGFTAITMRRLWDAFLGLDELPRRPVVLTFDDGYDNAYGSAAPLLLERGMTGTFYIVSGFMQQPGYLSWGQAAEMQRAGLEIGCHSATHRDMSRMGYDEAYEEIAICTDAITAAVGQRPVSFCYPFGRHNAHCRRALAALDYATAVTTSDATLHYASNPYRMGRVRIRHTTGVRGLEWLVNRRV